MRVLEHLEPARVFYYFEALSAIPHGSRNTKAISDYCVSFAREHGLQCHQDEVNNVIIVKEATPGYEDAGTVILQGHLDMVCEKALDCTLDMEREGLELAVEGDSVLAKGTTLGGDDGIAVAMALAVLESDTLAHPRLEAVFTVDEEIGMLGATALDGSLLRGRRLINIDSEIEGILTVSCAGGVIAKAELPLARESVTGPVYTVTVDGLLGGHSGIEIDKGRGMANELLGRFLCALNRRAEFRLVSCAGGLKDNAIAREASARLVCGDEAVIRALAAELDEAFRKELAVADPQVRLTLTGGGEETVSAMDEASTCRVVHYLALSPSGAQVMSRDIPGLVQTSLNLGILSTEETKVTATYCVRSSVASQKQMLVDRLADLAAAAGGVLSCAGDYPAWEYQKESALRDIMVEVFRRQYGHDPKVDAVHAGLECGILCGKLEGLDCVSIGPDLTKIHTSSERMSISSVQRVWNYLVEVLRCCR